MASELLVIQRRYSNWNSMLKIFIAKDYYTNILYKLYTLYKYILEFNQRKQNGMEKFICIRY